MLLLHIMLVLLGVISISCCIDKQISLNDGAGAGLKTDIIG